MWKSSTRTSFTIIIQFSIESFDLILSSCLDLLSPMHISHTTKLFIKIMSSLFDNLLYIPCLLSIIFYSCKFENIKSSFHLQLIKGWTSRELFHTFMIAFAIFDPLTEHMWISDWFWSVFNFTIRSLWRISTNFTLGELDSEKKGKKRKRNHTKTIMHICWFSHNTCIRMLLCILDSKVGLILQPTEEKS